VTVQTPEQVDTTVDLIVDLIHSKKGENITLIDLRGITAVVDVFVIATCSSSTHLKAVADEVRINLKNDHKILPWHAEGYEQLQWILLDYVDVVVHLFDRETRERYSLETLWKDAEIRHLEDVSEQENTE
jgi:ribosome-associated protein